MAANLDVVADYATAELSAIEREELEQLRMKWAQCTNDNQKLNELANSRGARNDELKEEVDHLKQEVARLTTASDVRASGRAAQQCLLAQVGAVVQQTGEVVCAVNGLREDIRELKDRAG